MSHQQSYRAASDIATSERERERKQVLGETKRGESIPAPEPVNTQ